MSPVSRGFPRGLALRRLPGLLGSALKDDRLGNRCCFPGRHEQAHVMVIKHRHAGCIASRLRLLQPIKTTWPWSAETHDARLRPRARRGMISLRELIEPGSFNFPFGGKFRRPPRISQAAYDAEPICIRNLPQPPPRWKYDTSRAGLFGKIRRRLRARRPHDGHHIGHRIDFPRLQESLVDQ